MTRTRFCANIKVVRDEVRLRSEVACAGSGVPVGRLSGASARGVSARRSESSKQTSISVLIVDDEPLLRLGTRALIENVPGIEVVGEASDGNQAVAQAAALRPDVVLMDVQMPGMNGVKAASRILAVAPESRILVLTTFDRDEYVFGALRAGASGFLLKECSAEELLDGLFVVAHGNTIVTPRATRALREMAERDIAISRPAPTCADQLSSRERDVLQEIAKGQSNREIAGRLFISEATVKSHIASILRKLGLRDRVHIAIYAHRNGIASEP